MVPQVRKTERNRKIWKSDLLQLLQLEKFTVLEVKKVV